MPSPSEMPVLALRERSSVVVQEDEWSALSSERSFWKLVSDGVLSVDPGDSGIVRLSAHGWIGRGIVGNRIIEIGEKVDGAAKALFEFASRGDSRAAPVDGIVGSDGIGVEVVAKYFLAQVRVAVSMGIPRAYSKARRLASIAGGKLLVTDSLRKRASGLGHLLVSEQPRLTTNTPVNVVTALALTEVVRMAGVGLLSKRVALEARRLAILFEEARDHSLSALNRSERIAWISNALRYPLTTSQAELVELSLFIVAQSGFSGDMLGVLAKRAFFLNLALPFERAVRKAFDASSISDRVLDGRKRPGALTVPDSDYLARPDLVIEAGDIRVIGDAKYKAVDANLKPEASDLYQILAHSAAYSAHVAMLVFPGDVFAVRLLGVFKPGLPLYAVTVRLSELGDDCCVALREIVSCGVFDGDANDGRWTPRSL